MFAFSPSQEHFAAVTADGRLRIWNVASNAIEQELTERDHLSCTYTAIAWTLRSPLIKSSKRSKATCTGIIALGTSTGNIVVWDLQQGKVISKLTDASASASTAGIHDLAFNSQGSLVFSCSADKFVREWSLADAKVVRQFRCGSEGAQKLAISGRDDLLAVGGTSIRVFDLASGKRVRKLVAGLSSKVHALAFSTCQRMLFSSTIGDRFVNMYDMESSDNSDEPAVIFSLPSNPSGFCVRTHVGKKKADVVLAAVANGGALFVWRHKHKLSTRSTQPRVPDITSRTTDSKTSPGVLLATTAKEEEESSDMRLRVVRGSNLKPVFETVSLLDEQQQLRTELTFAPISEHLLLDDASASKQKRQRVEAEGEADETTHIPTLADRNASTRVQDGTVTMDTSDDNDEDAEDDDVPLSERLEALRERLDTDLAATMAIANAEPQTGADNERPDAASLSSLLEQALQAHDNTMLEYCLRTRDLKVIRTTIQRVSPVKVLALLEILVLKFEKSPGRSARLCPWIRAILLHHTAFLVAQPDLVRHLSGLYQLLEHRLKVHTAMHQLSGKLNLVLGQLNEASAAAAAPANSESTDKQAKTVYEEAEDDGDEETDGNEDEDTNEEVGDVDEEENDDDENPADDVSDAESS